MTTIAREARIRFAKRTVLLADPATRAQVIRAQFDAIVADLDFGTVTIDADEEFEFTCEWNGHGTNKVFVRADNRDGGTEIHVCEHHADTADVSHIAD